jgi:hypothetical protein
MNIEEGRKKKTCCGYRSIMNENANKKGVQQRKNTKTGPNGNIRMNKQGQFITSSKGGGM